MLTRGAVSHQYYPAPVGRIVTPGYVRVLVPNKGPQIGVPQTWAITRPGSAPDSNGAPHYLQGDRNYQIQRSAFVPLQLRRNRVEMDPSNPDTWQRPYRFDK